MPTLLVVQIIAVVIATARTRSVRPVLLFITAFLVGWFVSRSVSIGFLVSFLQAIDYFVVIALVIMAFAGERKERVTTRYTERIVQRTRKCPYCAEIINDDAKICRLCGRDLPVSVMPVASSSSAPATNYRTCLNCRESNSRTAVVCKNCGTPLSPIDYSLVNEPTNKPKGVICPNCGETNTPGGLYCAICQSRL